MAEALDLSEFESANISKPKCKVATANISSEQREKLDAALADRRYKGTDITRVLRKWGVEISHPTLIRHRNGDCQCHRT